MSAVVMPNTLPQSILMAVLDMAVSGDRFRNNKPNAIDKENITPITTSVFNFAVSAKGPRARETKVENKSAKIKGSFLKNKPRAAPANAAWDMANPSDERFILTTNVPIREQV